MPHPTQTSEITAVRDVAPGVREIALAAPAERVEFKPGQWLSLHLPVGEHPPLVRAYSLAAGPVASGELVLCLDRVPEGLGSDYLFSVGVGDALTFAGPLGNFVLPEGEGELLWLARYTGIVPFRSMLLHLGEHAPADRAPVTLLYSAETVEDLAYRDELEALAAELPWFRLRLFVDEAAAGWSGETGEVLEALPALVGERTDRTPMVCGKKAFVRPIRDFFYGLGYERKAVKWENYD